MKKLFKYIFILKMLLKIYRWKKSFLRNKNTPFDLAAGKRKPVTIEHPKR